MKQIILLGFIFCVSTFKTQIYSLTQFSRNDGLPSAYIYDIGQDEKGFLAIATGEGLVYYGGSKFVTFDTTTGMGDNIISCLSSNKNGEVVVGHIKNGISKRVGYEFENIEASKRINSPISCILHDSNKTIFGTKDGHLGILDSNTIKLISIENATFINKIIKTKSAILIATDNGIYRFDGKTAQLIKSTEGIHFTSLSNYWNDKLLAGSEAGEIFVYKSSGNPEMLEQLSSNMVCKNTPIKSIIHTTGNKIILASWGRGIYTAELDFATLELKNKKNISDENGLGSLFVSALYKDFSENVWIGTFGGGLYKFNNNHFRIYNKKSGLYLERIKSVLLAKDKVFVGMESGFQILYPDKTDTLVVYNSQNKFVDDKVTSMAKINDFNFLIGTENKGVFLFDIQKNTFTDYFKKIGVGSSPKTINHIHFGKDSSVYISTIDGLYVYRIKKKEFKKLTTDQGLPHNNILSTFLDSDNRLWFIAPKSVPGLIQRDSIVLFKDIPNFGSYNTTSICEGRMGNIYITTGGDGIYKYNNGTFTQYTTKSGLLSNFVLNATFDRGKEVLVSTHQNGFSVFDVRSNKIRSVTSRSNLNTFESSVNSIAIESSNVYFGTEQGLGVYLINEEKTNCPPPKNSILRILINKIAYTQKDSVIELPYSEYDIQLDYIGIELTYPEEIFYTYKLEGIEKNFKTTKERRIEYSKLNEGTYTFILYSTNYLGIRNTIPVKITIIIDKPLYKKWWFICLVLITLASIVYLLIYIRTRNLVKQRIVLQKKVKESTRKILSINKILESKNLHIMSSIDYAQRIQKVLLPKKEQINKNIDAFIYYEPKDIVSGDFYWFHSTEKYTYIAAVDCTGHGVPGAFMSIIGTFFLDQILAELKEPMPSTIISELDKRIVKSLRQNDHADRIADGMDVALCRIDREKSQLVFCGAHRPLYFFSKNELTEFKSARYSVGGGSEAINKEFTDEIITYQHEDMCYIFSDGFADQFGGERNARYSTKKFKDMFKRISTGKTKSQLTEVREEFKNWKGKSEQTDDILVIGIKLIRSI